MFKKSLVAVIVLAMMLAVFACHGSYRMYGSSMEPTFHAGDRVTASPVNRELQRGDIVFYTVTNITLMHRVIGLPGETIEVKDGQVYINGIALAEPYIAEKPLYSVDPILIPQGHYFLLGDNRMKSSDSHNRGPIAKDSIIGILNR